MRSDFKDRARPQWVERGHNDAVGLASMLATDAFSRRGLWSAGCLAQCHIEGKG